MRARCATDPAREVAALGEFIARRLGARVTVDAASQRSRGELDVARLVAARTNTRSRTSCFSAAAP